MTTEMATATTEMTIATTEMATATTEMATATTEMATATTEMATAKTEMTTATTATTCSTKTMTFLLDNDGLHVVRDFVLLIETAMARQELFSTMKTIVFDCKLPRKQEFSNECCFQIHFLDIFAFIFTRTPKSGGVWRQWFGDLSNSSSEQVQRFYVPLDVDPSWYQKYAWISASPETRITLDYAYGILSVQLFYRKFTLLGESIVSYEYCSAPTKNQFWSKTVLIALINLCSVLHASSCAITDVVCDIIDFLPFVNEIYQLAGGRGGKTIFRVIEHVFGALDRKKE